MSIKERTAVQSKKKLILPIILGIIGVGAIGITTYVLTGNSLYELNPFAYVAGFGTSLSGYKKVTLTSDATTNVAHFLQVSDVYPTFLNDYLKNSQYWDASNDWGWSNTKNLRNVDFYRAPPLPNGDIEYTATNTSVVNNSNPGFISIERQRAFINATSNNTNIELGPNNYAHNNYLSIDYSFFSYDSFQINFTDCTKANIITKFKGYNNPYMVVAANPVTIPIAYPKVAHTYYVSTPICYAPNSSTWQSIYDYRSDKKNAASLTHGDQMGNLLIVTTNDGVSGGSYTLENMYFSDNPESYNYFDRTYCMTTTSGTLDKLHCEKRPGNKNWHTISYVWNGTINGKSATRTFYLMGFSQFTTRPYTFTYNAQDPKTSELIGGMYQYRWWEDIAKYRSNASSAWRWDQDWYEDYNGDRATLLTKPTDNPTWIITAYPALQ